jgi:hypothetical protein
VAITGITGITETKTSTSTMLVLNGFVVPFADWA